jgi:nucleotide-binding universal stress UspA family protein
MAEFDAPEEEEREHRIAFRTVVCGIDGTSQSLEAAGQALQVADPAARYHGISAWDPYPAYRAGFMAPALIKGERDHARTALLEATERFRALEPMLFKGRDVPSLIAAIVNLKAELISVGSHGRSRAAGIVFGSVASAMAHHAPCSVLIARQPPAGSFPGLLLHANDGSPESLDAARVAGELGARHDSTLLSLHVGDTRDEAVDEQADVVMEESGREPVFRIEQGSPHRKIVEVADGADAGLIVIGSRGRTGLAALGSVAERVSHHAPCSVLIVRRPAHPAPDEGGS